MPPARRFPPGHFPQLHLVTPAVVERTIARVGVAGLLSERERETLDTLALEKRRRDWIAGRLAAKRAVRRSAGHRAGGSLPYSAITIWNDESGAPRLTVDGHPWLGAEMNVSLAHADGAAVAAVANTEREGSVGVDIEGVTQVNTALVQRVMSPVEVGRIAHCPWQPDPLAIWTVKEAGFKAARTVCSALRDVELGWAEGNDVSARIVGPDVPPHSLAVSYRVVQGYSVAVALYRAVA